MPKKGRACFSRIVLWEGAIIIHAALHIRYGRHYPILPTLSGTFNAGNTSFHVARIVYTLLYGLVLVSCSISMNMLANTQDVQQIKSTVYR